MTVIVVAGEVIASIYAGGGTGRRDHLIPELYRAKLVTMHGDGMLLKGYERPAGWVSDTDEYRQEWSVKVMAPPPKVPAPSERLG